MLLPGWGYSQETLKAPNAKASPINQRRAYGNACGPASLLNAFQYGNEKWQKIFHAVPGDNSKSKIRYVVAAWGNKPSKHIKGTNRWNAKQGINLLDLTDMANEMRASHFVPKIKYKVLDQNPMESKTRFIKRCHSTIAKSMTRGLPPIVSIRRYAYRYNKEVGQKSWWPIRAHFVVITEIPKSLPQGATSFRIRYVDPYGGFVREGRIHTETGSFSRCPYLGATLPKTEVGKSFVKAGEETLLTLSAIIGTW
ncbi:hypothetical protein HW115_15800 [Verrucomicrobiaceae bacterium N1E253]|uniref:Peptidase C39-like domain-containing protein n=2 Tax=Oceaniferula marina TaxID=2748318 RepID=A0A851GIA4_9BACT|nr:hypothetical protein [Oceaniferula marina]